jgi:hypothetical protein
MEARAAGVVHAARMRTALHFALRVIATVVLFCAAVAGNGVDTVNSASASILTLLCVTGGCGSFVAIARARRSDGVTTVRNRPPSFRALGLATVICIPVAFGLGLWDALQSSLQTGCLRSTFAPLLLPLIWVCHQEAIGRYSADSDRTDP